MKSHMDYLDSTVVRIPLTPMAVEAVEAQEGEVAAGEVVAARAAAAAVEPEPAPMAQSEQSPPLHVAPRSEHTHHAAALGPVER